MPLLLSLILACGNEDGSSTPLVAQLGTGEWEWEALENGDDVPVILGPQGGHHLLGSVRVSGLEAGDSDNISDEKNPTTSFYVWVNDVNLTPGARYTQGLDPVAETIDPYTHEMVGRFAILDIEDDDELDGVELTFEVVVEDVEGNLVSDLLELIAYPHPYND